MPWAIAFVPLKKEYAFEKWLLDRGVETYLPRSRGMTRAKKLRRMVETIRPAFGNYVFVKSVNDSVEGIEDFHHYAKYLTDEDGRVSVVQDEQIDEIKSREKAGEFDNLPEDLNLLFRGNPIVEIISGLFEGRRGRVIRVCAGKARVDLGGKFLDLPLVFLKKCA